jgi:hypothetical protein
MTSIEKLIVKYIDDKFGFPYLYYDKVEQTWANEFFLFDIKTGTMYVGDIVKSELNNKYGKGYMDQIFLLVVREWFKKDHKLIVKEIV